MYVPSKENSLALNRLRWKPWGGWRDIRLRSAAFKTFSAGSSSDTARIGAKTNGTALLV